MQFHNTLSGRKETFVPLDPQRVTMYLCGPTVYSYAHIGNARPAVAFDVLSRLLRRRFPKLEFARNITDIDDKINKAAAEQKVEIGVITEKFAAAYHDDMSALGVNPPDHEPRVTQSLPQIVAMVERLIAAGHAYEAEGNVLFHTPSYAEYGALSKRDAQALVAGSRVEVAPYKKHAGDFILWKPSTPDQPGWDSPWGRGRPGWHIECSAMAETHLGETIDIHCGGHDLIFPHHENEIAQSVCSHGGQPFSRYWLHNGFLNVNSEKMSKSIGNVLLVRDLLKEAPGEAIRLVLMTAHYRQPLDWTDEVLGESRKKLDRLYGALRELADVEERSDAGEYAPFIADLEDDLNTPGALARLFELAHQANTVGSDDRAQRSRIKAQLLDCGRLLGLLQWTPEQWFGWTPPREGLMSAAEVESLLADRTAARKAKNWAESDRVRDLLKSRGVLVEDSKDGQRWRHA
ncbi:MAG: cysteine--tRNA ligase [Panacagrimonas sp.]